MNMSISSIMQSMRINGSAGWVFSELRHLFGLLKQYPTPVLTVYS